MKRLLCFLLSSVFLFALSEATQLLPQPAESFNFNLTYIQQAGSCSYSVVISTSCSSPSYTRDHISLSFGDAYGNQIYVPRIDDPSRRTFERCSTDTFHINGPCAYQICYVYLYRSGPDAWIPTTVKISGDNSRPITFNYNTAIPNDVWFGFNLCGHASSSNRLSSCMWFIYVIGVWILALLLF
ncbi:embryo-specific protein ATS3B-like isoform X2 [Momordica charantia]|uniref:Embryo-specific protein ATS3B-like isoform X2 n=2 Tax=Momordica charantia TaxID=3673 RepID=A0A6J1CJ97_MOMCH|nr:embryo-specific protein ATS3B-like isoform X2 [Momordica charantia]